MTLEEKYNQWNDIFWKYFIVADKDGKQGTNIPFESYNFDKDQVIVGDGTINIAQLLTYMWVSKKNNVTYSINCIDCLTTLHRLEFTAWEYFLDKFPSLDFPYYFGFFLRDDCNQSNVVCGAWYALHNTYKDDPCYSPFVSQDQVWNLNPILMQLHKEGFPLADLQGEFNNAYIKNNGYTIYNPYLSYVNHFFKYLPANVNDMDARREEREKAFKPNVKVKRGANNWYYSGGTKACYDAFTSDNYKYKHSLRTFLYRTEIFFLDRIYEPIYKLITGKDFKHNSYHCYAATSGIWYNNKFAKRFKKRFNKYLSKGKLFEGNIAPIVLQDGCDTNKLKAWLESYPEPTTTGSVNSPLEFLTMYQFWKSLTNK